MRSILMMLSMTDTTGRQRARWEERWSNHATQSSAGGGFTAGAAPRSGSWRRRPTWRCRSLHTEPPDPFCPSRLVRTNEGEPRPHSRQLTEILKKTQGPSSRPKDPDDASRRHDGEGGSDSAALPLAPPLVMWCVGSDAAPSQFPSPASDPRCADPSASAHAS